MKVTYTGMSTITSFKKSKEGIKYVLVGILYQRPGWEGYCAETKVLSYDWYDTISRFKPDTDIDIQEFNNQIVSISAVK